MNEYFEWNPCTEEQYPEDSDCIIIAYRNEIDNKWQYWLYNDCPYGWNVLCRSEAYWKIIKEPVK